MSKRAILYSRVSTQDQTQNSSLERQLSVAREYAEGKGYIVIAEVKEIISGSFVLARSEFNRFLEMASEGQADVLVVDIPDRLGRGDTIAKCELLAEMNRAVIEYASPGRDETTVEGMALKATDMLVSGIERINIRRRTVEGKKAWASKGRVIASPYRPYGYRFVNEYHPHTRHKISCEMVIVPNEAKTVLEMFEWCVYEGLTPYKIAKRLTALKVPTLSDIDKVNKKKLGEYGRWHNDTVRGILTNETYKGIWHYGKNRVTRVDSSEGVKTKVAKAKKPISVEVPAIVSEELWEAAQDQLERIRKRNHKPTKNNYLLRGRLRCGRCGGAMAGHTTKKKTQSYRCARKYVYGVKSPVSCKVRNVLAVPVETAVWDYLYDLLLDEEKLFGKIEANQQETMRGRKILEQDIVALEVLNEKERDSIERLVDLYSTGDIDKAGYRERTQKLKSAIKEREELIQQKKASLNEMIPLDSDREATLRHLRIEISKRLEGASFEQKQQLLEALQVECVYHDDTGQLTISGSFGSELVAMRETAVPGKKSGGGNGGTGGKGGFTASAISACCQ